MESDPTLIGEDEETNVGFNSGMSSLSVSLSGIPFNKIPSL
jgi:hypothetical protein